MNLNSNDKVGIIALSGDCDSSAVESACKFFEEKGLKTELSKNIFDKKAYLAGSDEIKIKELHRFFSDPSVKIIINARGGYGAIRLINKIDYDLISKNPKPFCGFSDITALLLMLYKNSNIVTYHSPMACSDFGNRDNSYKDVNYDYLMEALSGKKLVFEGTCSYNEGYAEGIIWGGNLSTVVSLCGTDFIPEKDFIFFTEDLNEPVYKIDRMFTQLFNIEKFKKYCKGIVLGDFINTDDQNILNEFFINLASENKIPISKGFEITHSYKKMTIPVGRPCIMNNYQLVIESF